MIARADFQAEDFNQLIQQKGYRLLWEPAVNCPCLDPQTTRPVEGCPQCDGRGKFYYSAMAQEIKGIITHQNTQMEIDAMAGRLQPGNGYLTTESKYRLTSFDRITNLDSVGIYHETLIWEGDVDDFYLRYTPAAAIELACYQPSKKSPVIVLQQGFSAEDPKDFMVIDYTAPQELQNSDGGKIIFTDPTRFPIGTGISFRYVHHPVWLVTGIPNYVRDTFIQQGNPIDTATAMPIRVEIQLEMLGKARG